MKSKLLNDFLYVFPIVVVLVIIPCLSSCGDNIKTIDVTTQENATLSQTSLLTETPGLFEVYITESGFVPQEITIIVGSTLNWINKDNTWRAVGEEIPTGESGFDYPYGSSGQLQPGETYSRIFDLPGVWDYWCPKTLQVGRVYIKIER